jgi:hypothetical protein
MFKRYATLQRVKKQQIRKSFVSKCTKTNSSCSKSYIAYLIKGYKFLVTIRQAILFLNFLQDLLMQLLLPENSLLSLRLTHSAHLLLQTPTTPHLHDS